MKNVNKLTKIVLSSLLCISMLCSCSIEFEEYQSESSVTVSENNLSVHYLDVGQGDSIFIEFPDSDTMLIDSGENYHGESIIDYITDCGYSDIDYLVATHPHTDHIGSMGYIVRNFEIGSVYMPKVSANTKTYENLLESISDKGLKVKSAKEGTIIKENNDLTVEVVAPATIDSGDLNNCSLVMKITYKDVSYLFTGDAEKKELKEITSDISSDVLKVGHHGSSTSTYEEFLEAVNPAIAVISVGEDNEYGHPHESTITLLEEFDCEIYRTDEDDTVKVSTDGYEITVDTEINSIERAK